MKRKEQRFDIWVFSGHFEVGKKKQKIILVATLICRVITITLKIKTLIF